MTVVVHDRGTLAKARADLPGRVGVVMTMGALHDGHAALVRAAAEVADGVLVTVFVNPLQFGEAADLERYPRTLDADVALCESLGVDVVFAPDVEEMYGGTTPTVMVSSGALGTVLEGASRPGHFDGVCTVVLKLLHLTRPDVALYGEKDAQQLAVIRRMVADLDVPVEVVGVPTVREPDGLAMSSRNRFLSAAEREQSLALHRALRAGAGSAAHGPAGVRSAATEVLAAAGIAPDYLALVDDATWDEADDSTTVGRLLVAARLGTTRLIDNVTVDLGTPRGLKE